MHYIQKLKLHQVKWATLVVGSLIVGAWTLLRFMVKNTNFDLVGQQELAHQWLQGYHSGAHIGPTNYVLKMVLLYMPADLLGITPRVELIGITLLINIITFVVLVWVLQRIWLQFYSRIPRAFYLAMLWLATMAGSMYWIQFSNSRNLEMVGGLVAVWLLLRLRQRSSAARYVSLVLVMSIVVFADPLQLYMTILPGVLFVVGSLVIRSEPMPNKLRRIATIGLTLIASFVLAKLYMHVVVSIYHPLFLVVGDQTAGLSKLNLVVQGTPQAIKQMLRLYVGGYELGRYVEALNLCFVAGVGAVSVAYAWSAKIRRGAIVFVATFVLVDGLIYVVSGQALQAGTSRYLIMTVPCFALVVAMVLHATSRLKRVLSVITMLIVIINMLSIAVAMTRHWDTNFQQDAHIRSVISYMHDRRYSYGYASMDSAIPGDYLSANSIGLIPLSCEVGGQTQTSLLFFDKAYIAQLQSQSLREVPLILDGQAITNTPHVCTAADISELLGEPLRIEHTSDGSLVLIYRPAQLERWHTP